MMDAFRKIQTTFDESASRIDELAGHGESFASSAETLTNASKQQVEWLDACQGSLTDLNKKLEAFDELAKTAASAFPIIKSNLEEITEGLKETNQEINSNLVEIAEGLKETNQEINSNLVEIAEGLKETNQEINQSIKQTVTDNLAAMANTIERLEGGVQKTRDQLESAVGELGTELVGIVRNIEPVMGGSIRILQEGVKETTAQLLTLTQKLEQEVVKVVESLQRNLLGASESHRESLDQSVEKLSGMLEEELTRSLQSLGNQLATLSHQFVDDYGPLTEKLREVVELARSMTDREPEEGGSEKESSDEGV
jgi:uncharacterized phage infection (PIP) family protein YhgE